MNIEGGNARKGGMMMRNKMDGNQNQNRGPPGQLQDRKRRWDNNSDSNDNRQNGQNKRMTFDKPRFNNIGGNSGGGGGGNGIVGNGGYKSAGPSNNYRGNNGNNNSGYQPQKSYKPQNAYEPQAPAQAQMSYQHQNNYAGYSQFSMPQFPMTFTSYPPPTTSIMPPLPKN
jgi:hypothetical protein